MPTLTAVRRNPWLKAHYERLRARGKLPKVALVACMRKLLHAVYASPGTAGRSYPNWPAARLDERDGISVRFLAGFRRATVLDDRDRGDRRAIVLQWHPTVGAQLAPERVAADAEDPGGVRLHTPAGP